MSSESKSEDLHGLLMNLEVISGIIGTAIVKSNGLLITSRLPRDIDDRKFGAMAATMFGAIETAIKTLGPTKFNNLIVELGTEYQLIVLKITDQIILVSLLDLNVNLGLILIEIEETIKKIKAILNF
ncbi:MAG: roadblock/LC7 domain-containing protein [Candidatus Hodarchaeota archaeon]